MPRYRLRPTPLILVAALLFAVVLEASPAAPAKRDRTAGPEAAVRSLVSQGKYKEAIARLRVLEATAPGNAALAFLHVQSLMGLGRYLPAARLALREAQTFPTHPEFRLEGGVCAFRLGYLPQALAQWRALYRRPGSRAEAYHLSVRALMAKGQTSRAKSVLEQALSTVSPPSEDLALDELSLEHSPKACITVLDALLKTNPPDEAYFKAQLALLKAAGSGKMLDTTAPSKGPIRIPLKEKNSHMDLPAVGGGDLQVSSTERLSTSTNVVVQARLDGTDKRWMLLDSGSAVPMINEDTAESLKLTPVAAGRYQGLGSERQQKTEWVLIPEIQFGSVTIRNVPALVIPKKADFWNKRGIIPLALFDRWAVHYNRRHSYMELYPSGTDPTKVMGPGTFSPGAVWSWGKPCLRASIQGRSGLFCQVDTGSASTFVSASCARELGIKANTARYGSYTGLSVTGYVESGIAQNVDVKVAGANFHMPTVPILKMGLSTRLIPVSGNIGREILDLFDIFVDYHRGVVAFKPYDKP
jgi:tetratricopeptide (TPR) repeat protein